MLNVFERFDIIFPRNSSVQMFECTIINEISLNQYNELFDCKRYNSRLCLETIRFYYLRISYYILLKESKIPLEINQGEINRDFLTAYENYEQ